MMKQDIEQIFSNLGGQFLSKPDTIAKKFKNIKGLLFDWDGVFNSGIKSSLTPSTFSEIDSMGINLLRFSLWLETKEIIFTGIITGMSNETAFELAKREHFNSVYFNFKSKKEALQHIKTHLGIKPAEMLFVFDDVLDISVAKLCGLSFFVNRKSSPLFTQYVIDNKLADYVAANRAEGQAIREICELLLGLGGKFNEVVNERIAFSEKYINYFKDRNQISSSFYYKSDNKIIETTI